MKLIDRKGNEVKVGSKATCFESRTNVVYRKGTIINIVYTETTILDTENREIRWGAYGKQTADTAHFLDLEVEDDFQPYRSIRR